MANPDASRGGGGGGGVRHVRCPKCHSLLQEPPAPVYQCGGCGTTLRAKIRQDTASSAASPSRSGLPVPPHAQRGSADVRSSEQQQPTATTSRRGSGDLVSARRHGTGGDVASTSSTPDATGIGRHVTTSDLVSARNSDRSGDVTTSSSRRRATDTRIRRESGGDLGSASKHAPAAAVENQSATNRDRGFRGQADAVSPGGRGSRGAAASESERRKHSPRPRDERRIKGEAGEDLAPLRAKILNAVDALKGDLSELFSKSPDFNPARRARRPNPNQEETRAHRQAPRAVKKPGQLAAAPLRGLPSRRYRRCRADPPPCGHPRHGCCCGRHHQHGKCGTCRGHCGRHDEPPSAPPAPPAAKKEEPRKRWHHCRPVLKGAPFLVCSHCFALVQVPADFAVPTTTNALRRLRCGACSAVLSYSYRDPARKKQQPSVEQLSADGCSDGGKGKAGAGYPADPFFDGLSSYSTTEDEQPPLHVSRSTSLHTLDGVKGVGRLHRLMGYGSATELLRRSPDLYERTTPDYDSKGKGVCVDDGAEDDFDDSDDEECGGGLKRSAARGAVWPLPGKAPPAPGAIRIKS